MGAAFLRGRARDGLSGVSRECTTELLSVFVGVELEGDFRLLDDVLEPLGLLLERCLVLVLVDHLPHALVGHLRSRPRRLRIYRARQ